MNKVLFNITRYGTNPATSKPYEYNEIDNNDTKYSYIDKESYEGSKSFLKGYFVFNSFSKLSHTQADLTAIFNKFQHACSTDIIIDLLITEVGISILANFLLIIIAPNSLNGKVMFTENFNSTMQNNTTKYLKNLSVKTTNSKGEKVKVKYTDLDYSISGNTYKFSPRVT